MKQNPAVKQISDAAQAKLTGKDGKPTAHYVAYMRYADEYKLQEKAWQDAYAAAFDDPMQLQNWPIEGRSFVNGLDQALQRWVSLGFKTEIEEAMRTLAVQGSDPKTDDSKTDVKCSTDGKQ